MKLRNTLACKIFWGGGLKNDLESLQEGLER